MTDTDVFWLKLGKKEELQSYKEISRTWGDTEQGEPGATEAKRFNEGIGLIFLEEKSLLYHVILNFRQIEQCKNRHMC